MSGTADQANVVIPPPIAWALAFGAGLVLDWFYRSPFVPPAIPRAWVGGGVLALGFALGIWAVTAIRGAGSRVEPNKPTTAIVADGPFKYSRNPIYLGIFLGQVGLAIGFDSLWVLVMLIPLYLVIRYGVVAREETYLTRKFGAVYTGYKSRVRRWL